jgi:hypothetical protein
VNEEKSIAEFEFGEKEVSVEEKVIDLFYYYIGKKYNYFFYIIFFIFLLVGLLNR